MSEEKKEAAPHDATSKKRISQPKMKAIAISGDIAGPLASPDAIRAAGVLLEARLKAMIDVISRNLVKGQDYGSITIVDKNGREHETKDTLFKPGSEKIMALFNWRAHFSVDEETRRQLAPDSQVFCYLCQLLSKSGEVAGEGRGACSMDETRGNANNAIKRAQKRAQVDAVLRTSIMSYFFSADLEDEAEKDPNTGKQIYQENGNMTQAQQRFLFSLMKENNIAKENVEKWLLERHNVIGIENTPKRVASELLDALVRKYGQPRRQSAQPKEEVPTIDLDEANEENEEHATATSL